jgi:UPF0755 protein
MTTLNELFSEEPLPPSRHSKTLGRRVVVLALLAGVAALAAGVFFALSSGSEPNDYEGEGSGSVTIVVGRGESLTSIGETLVEAGVIKTTQAFVDATALNEESSTIGPGQYTLREQMSGSSALALMLDPASRADSRLVLREGLRLDQTLDAAATATGLPLSDFEDVIADADQLPLPDWADAKPEGFMFPATYELIGDETAEGLLDTLVKRFNQSAANISLEERAAAVGKSPYEVVIIASLLEAELVPEDFAKGAAVVYNRLDADMPLQFDSTVSYALGIQELQLNAEQLKTDSPYNTYQVRGLPPTPINSPGEAALEAALSPAKGKWLYFVAVNPDTRETKFARTYERFLELKNIYREFLESNDN